MLEIFKRKEVIIPFRVPDYIIFDVDNFNNWFNARNNNAVYANSGIFLRLDKLSESHITDYLLKCYGITETNYSFGIPVHILVYDFYKEIRKDWKQKTQNK